MFVVADTAVVLSALGTKSTVGYDTAKQQSATDVQSDQLAYTSSCLVLNYNNATSQSLVDHGRTPARFALSARRTLRIAKPTAEVIEILTSVKTQRYTFQLILPTRWGLSVAFRMLSQIDMHRSEAKS